MAKIKRLRKNRGDAGGSPPRRAPPTPCAAAAASPRDASPAHLRTGVSTMGEYTAGVVIKPFANDCASLRAGTDKNLGREKFRLPNLGTDKYYATWFLRAANIFFCVLHLILAAVFAALFAVFYTRSETQVVGSSLFGIIFRHRLADASVAPLAAAPPITVPPRTVISKSAPMFRINVAAAMGIIVALFLVSATAHLLYATALYDCYTCWVLIDGRMPARWVEYGVSMALLAALLVAVAGVHDFFAAKFAVGAVIIMQVFSFIYEETHTFTPIASNIFIFAMVVVAFVWSFVDRVQDARRVADAANASPPHEKRTPTPWYGIVVASLILIAAPTLLHIVNHKTHSNFVYTEITYMTLSATLKTLVASFFAWGILTRSTTSS